MAIHLGDSGKKTNAAATTPTSAPSAPASSDAASPSADPSSSAETVGYQATGQASKDVGVPKFDAAAAAKPYWWTLHLAQGDVTFTALTDKAPYTTFSFEYLAQKKYFDATKCHRLTTSGIYVLQWATRPAPARAARATSSRTRT